MDGPGTLVKRVVGAGAPRPGSQTGGDRFACQYAMDGIGWKRHAGLVGTLRERESELAAVEVLLERRGGMLLLEGRAGIGKTSLVEVACARGRMFCARRC
jgi:MoxR-like ATPase